MIHRNRKASLCVNTLVQCYFHYDFPLFSLVCSIEIQ